MQTNKKNILNLWLMIKLKIKVFKKNPNSFSNPSNSDDNLEIYSIKLGV